MKTYYGSTEIQPGLFIVATRADRDAIPVETRLDKMQVFVKDTETTYILRGDLSNNANWQTIHQGRCGEVYDFRLNMHVAPPANGGSDETGDGTRAKPFATVNHALSKVPDRFSDPAEEFPAIEEPYFDYVSIRVGSGSYDFDSGFADTPWWKGDLAISIIGEMEVVEPTITVTGGSQTISNNMINTITLSSPISTIVDNDEDYILVNTDYVFGPKYVVLSGSTQNSLKLLTGGSNILSGQYELRKHATFFTPTSFDLTYPTKSSTKRLHDSIENVKIDATNVAFNAPFKFSYCSLIGPIHSINSLKDCYLEHNASGFTRSFPIFNPDNANSRVDTTYIKNTFSINNVNSSNNGSVIFASCIFDNSYIETGLDGFKTSFSLLKAYVKNVDTFLIINAPDTSVSLSSLFTLENVNTFANISRNGTLSIRAGSTVTGATTSVPVIVRSGSRLIGISSSNGLLTNSTNPGQEVQLGATLKLPISELPAIEIKEGVSAE